jgi:transcriptional regulator with XRE-family HTH domain
MSLNNWIKEKLELFKDDFDFRFETIILNLTERICERMKQKNINRTELADLLNVSPPAVTKILNGNSNFTLKTLLSLSDALEQKLEINLRDRETVNFTGVDVLKIIKYTTAYSDEEFLPADYDTIPSSEPNIGSFQIIEKKDWDEAA